MLTSKYWCQCLTTRSSESLRSDFPQRARSQIPENPAIVDVVIDGITVDFLFTIPGYDELLLNTQAGMIWATGKYGFVQLRI